MNCVSPLHSMTSTRTTKLQSRRACAHEQPRIASTLSLDRIGPFEPDAEQLPRPVLSPTDDYQRGRCEHRARRGTETTSWRTGVPGIIVRVKDAHHAARTYATGVDDARHRYPASAHCRVPGRKHHQDLRRHDRSCSSSAKDTSGSMSPSATRLPGLLSNGRRITVRQLLNHTSGLPDYVEDPQLVRRDRQEPRLGAARSWWPWPTSTSSCSRPAAPGGTPTPTTSSPVWSSKRSPATRWLASSSDTSFPLFGLDHTSFPVASAPSVRVPRARLRLDGDGPDR